MKTSELLIINMLIKRLKYWFIIYNSNGSRISIFLEINHTNILFYYDL